MQPDGFEQQRLVMAHHSTAPAACHTGIEREDAPDATRVAYVRVHRSTSQVRCVGIDGADDRLVFDNSPRAYDGWGQVAWSPDDSLLAAAIYPSQYPGVPQFDSFVQILNPDRTGVEIFRTTEGRNTFTCESSLFDARKFSAGDRVWSADSSRLVYMSDRDGNWEIYAFNVAGAAEVNLSRNPASDESPCWIALEGDT